MYFKNRKDAGKLLLEKFIPIPIDQKNTVVIALPRGGVPVALEIAQGLRLPLDIIIVKKIGVPSNPELAIGAVCEGNEVYYNTDLMNYFGYEAIDMEPFKLKAKQELDKIAMKLRKGTVPASLENKDVILVDDGIATGATMEVAVQLMKKKKVKNIFIAAPIAAPDSVKKLVVETTKVITVIEPEFLNSVGQWYEDFTQVETEEVIQILQNYSIPTGPEKSKDGKIKGIHESSWHM